MGASKFLPASILALVALVSTAGCSADVGDEDDDDGEEDVELLTDAEASALTTGTKAFGLGVDAPVAVASANFAKLSSSWKDGAYSLKTARIVFYIDLEADGTMDTAPLHTWVNAVVAGGLEPVVGVSALHRKGGWSGPKIDPVGRGFFTQKVAQIFREFPEVKRWGIVNEPDLELTGTTKERAKAAAVYYLDAKRALNVCVKAAKCTKDTVLIAGEFSYQGSKPAVSEAFWEAYGDALVDLVKRKKLASIPRIWAFHPYTDVSAGNVEGTRRFDAFLDRFEKRAGVKANSLRIWLTETGSLLHLSDRCETSAGNLNNQPQRQYERTKATFRLAKMQRVDRVYWWQFQQVAGHTWDSAMVDANGVPRPAFCALTKQPSSACTGMSYATQCKK